MLKQILFFLLLTTVGFSQSDSLIQKEVLVGYSSHVIPSSGITYSMYQAEISLKKQDWVVIPSLSSKKLHRNNGYQGGLDIYKKWKKGYGHSSIYYSPQNIFPTLILKGNIYRTFSKKFELQLGLNAVFFSEKELYSVNTGLSYYQNKIMINYSLQYYFNSPSAQSFMLRKYLRKNQDFIQIAYYYGIQEDLLFNKNNAINLHTVQCSFHKTVYKKTQLQFSVGTIVVDNIDQNQQYFIYRLAIKRRF